MNFTFDDVVTGMQQGNVVMAIDGAPLAGRILDPEQSKVAGNLGFAVVPGGMGRTQALVRVARAVRLGRVEEPRGRLHVP